MVIHKEFFFKHLNHQIFGQYWMPKECKAMVLLVHGMGEHSGRYTDEVIPELLAKHIAVCTYDNFGHGKSDGKRGYCPSYSALMELVKVMHEKAKELAKELPVFLYGHSMGGNLVTNYVIRYQPDVKGMIATSPLLRLSFQPPAWKITIGKVLQKILPSLTLKSGIDVNAISRIEDERQKYSADPLVHDQISANYSISVFEAGTYAIENGEQISVPSFFAHGTGDMITDYTATQQISEKVSEVTLQLFDDGFHELHNDLERDKLLSSITSWIQKKIAS